MYSMYLGGIEFPILPETFEVTRNGKEKTVTLINDGEISILKPEGLQELSFEVLLPAISENGNNADYYIKAFKAMIGNPVQFILIRGLNGGILSSTNLSVSIESLKLKDDVKYGYDILATFKLKEWKAYGAKVVTVNYSSKTISKAQTARS